MHPATRAATILFWWYAHLVPGTDRLQLGKLLPHTTADTPPPQSLAALPPEERVHYPAVYLPITYGDLSLYEQTRGTELARQNIEQRGALIAALRIDAANAYVNWNQTAAQRVAALRKIGIHVIPERDATGRTIYTSPLFAEEPPVRYRGSATHVQATKRAKGEREGKAKAKQSKGRGGGVATGRLSPVERQAIRHEQEQARGYSPLVDAELGTESPHRPVTTRHRPVPILPPDNSQRPLDPDDTQPWWGKYMSPHIHVSNGFGIPHSAGVDNLPLDGIHWPDANPTMSLPHLQHSLRKLKRRRYLRALAAKVARAQARPLHVRVSADQAMALAQALAKEQLMLDGDARYALGHGVDVTDRHGNVSLRLQAVATS